MANIIEMNNKYHKNMCYQVVIIVFLVSCANTLDIVHANHIHSLSSNAQFDGSKDPPRLPEQFSMNWTIYNVQADKPLPPYKDDFIPPPYSAGRGNTYYDWTKKAMIEIYYDFCVPIFQNGSNWRCHFLNVGGVSYLISLDKTSPYPPCCIFRKPFYPPSPDFVKPIPYNKTTTYRGKLVDWYVMPDAEAGPFGYGWYRDKLPSGTRRPGFFYFRGVPGFASQTFFNVTVGAPPASIFDVPDECRNAKSCGYP